MIVENSIQQFDTAVDIYKQFGSFSGLNLNWGKTIVIPLWTVPIELAKKELNSACHAAAAMDFSFWGTYLGFAVGPDRNKHIWTKAKDKFATRAMVWKESHQGLHFAAMTYNVFVITIISYIWQLAPVGKDILDEEARALRKINPGPGHWIQPCDWWLLKESWGHSLAFVSARHKSMAGATRIALTDAPDFRSRIGEVNHWSTESDFFGKEMCMEEMV